MRWPGVSAAGCHVRGDARPASKQRSELPAPDEDFHGRALVGEILSWCLYFLLLRSIVLF